MALPSLRDLDWLSGILEGEACFRWGEHKNSGAPRLALGMKDEDVIQRAKGIFGITTKTYTSNYDNGKFYSIVLSGRKAAAWMMVLYPLMGKRRQVRIREILLKWRSIGAHRPRSSPPNS